jgi:hypothetical protein
LGRSEIGELSRRRFRLARRGLGRGGFDVGYLRTCGSRRSGFRLRFEFLILIESLRFGQLCTPPDLIEQGLALSVAEAALIA